jgi:hypothetical protein
MHFQVKITLKNNNNHTSNFNDHKVGVSIIIIIIMVIIQKKNIKKSIQIKKKMHINSLI